MLINTIIIFLIFQLLVIIIYILDNKYWNKEYYQRNMDRYQKLLKMVNSFFKVSMNMNDTFGYGCADSENMDGEDIEEIFPLFEKYGFSTLAAYASVKRGYLPIKERQTEDFFKAKEEIEKLAKDGTVLWEEYWEKEGRNKY